jgi:hypothetical protein
MLYNWIEYERSEAARRDTGEHPTMGPVNLDLGGKVREHLNLSCHSGKGKGQDHENCNNKFWTQGESGLSKQTVLELIRGRVWPKEDTLKPVDSFLCVVQDPVD